MHAFCGVDRLSSNVRIISSLLVIFLVFVVTTVLVKVDTSDQTVEFFAVTLVSVAVVSGASNLFSGSVFGISGHFPMRISQALIAGTVLLNVTVFFYCLIYNVLLYRYAFCCLKIRKYVLFSCIHCLNVM